VAAHAEAVERFRYQVEVWMPGTEWNGNFEAVGNGCQSGSIRYAAMASALKAGYERASTAIGHEASSASFTLGLKQKDSSIKTRLGTVSCHPSPGEISIAVEPQERARLSLDLRA
jgi:hypothetical protein